MNERVVVLNIFLIISTFYNSAEIKNTLQALTVPVVGVLASAAGSASGWSSPSYAAATKSNKSGLAP